MAGQSNLQDVVQLNSNTLSIGADQIQLGTASGSKSIVFAQDPAAASALHLAASNPTGARTQVLQDANGTIGLITAISAGTTQATGGVVVFANSNNITFGMSAGSVTASFNAAAAAFGGVAAGTQTATTGTVVFSNSNNVTFGMSGSSVVTASFQELAYPLYLVGV